MLLLAVFQNAHTPPPASSVPMMVRVRVEQTCVLSTSGAVCGGSRDAPPRVTREVGRIVYSF
ncbi:hypothetical protein [Brevundimonas goettingensis]|uniref:Uncharacterized protein n=1 Tax=Brevundimonas goettingensis TaxID=2774190 RepID=A0A975C6P4_9CAUL|nr:hypothetical protein [Brevundimonas goettingensis]QTC92241.1 hypothetical protein IFJ75_04900 [Brevundimonas goettingensis]